jgi:hypothetical protein
VVSQVSGVAPSTDFRSLAEQLVGIVLWRGGGAWLNVPDSKSGVPSRAPWVRIPPSPPHWQIDLLKIQEMEWKIFFMKFATM